MSKQKKPEPLPIIQEDREFPFYEPEAKSYSYVSFKEVVHIGGKPVSEWRTIIEINFQHQYLVLGYQHPSLAHVKETVCVPLSNVSCWK